MAQAKFGYVICSEHRSGSTLLCQLLESTGCMGHPDEYFRHTEFSIAAERDPKVLIEMVDRASSPNGVYGFKLFTQQFDASLKTHWADKLPNLYFVHLERRDLLGQAISLVKARQTRQFESGENARAEPRYDQQAIGRQLSRIAEGHSRWRRYFARNGIEPLWLTYEGLIQDPAATISAIGRHIGLADPLRIEESSVHLEVQRNRMSDEWRARFIAEAADRTYLDHPLGKPRVWLRRAARDAGQLIRKFKPPT